MSDWFRFIKEYNLDLRETKKFWDWLTNLELNPVSLEFVELENFYLGDY